MHYKDIYYFTYPPTTEWMKNLKSPWSEENMIFKFMNTESTLLTSRYFSKHLDTGLSYND